MLKSIIDPDLSEKTFTLLYSLLFILNVFLLDTANAQLSTENILRAPFVSAQNIQHSSLGIHSHSNGFPSDAKSIMQNSEKDIIYIVNLRQIRNSKGNRKPEVLFLTRS